MKLQGDLSLPLEDMFSKKRDVKQQQLSGNSDRLATKSSRTIQHRRFSALIELQKPLGAIPPCIVGKDV